MKLYAQALASHFEYRDCAVIVGLTLTVDPALRNSKGTLSKYASMINYLKLTRISVVEYLKCMFFAKVKRSIY